MARGVEGHGTRAGTGPRPVKHREHDGPHFRGSSLPAEWGRSGLLLTSLRPGGDPTEREGWPRPVPVLLWLLPWSPCRCAGHGLQVRGQRGRPEPGSLHPKAATSTDHFHWYQDWHTG